MFFYKNLDFALYLKTKQNLFRSKTEYVQNMLIIEFNTLTVHGRQLASYDIFIILLLYIRLF